MAQLRSGECKARGEESRGAAEAHRRVSQNEGRDLRVLFFFPVTGEAGKGLEPV